MCVCIYTINRLTALIIIIIIICKNIYQKFIATNQHLKEFSFSFRFMRTALFAKYSVSMQTPDKSVFEVGVSQCLSAGLVSSQKHADEL